MSDASADSPTEKLAYNVGEAARALGLSKVTLYRQISAGALPVFRWGGRVLIRREVIQKLIEDASGADLTPMQARRRDHAREAGAKGLAARKARQA